MGGLKVSVLAVQFVFLPAALQSPVAQPAHLVIIGGGFGGLYAAREAAGAGLRVTIIDRKNHHTFQPLLYQVASAVLSPADIASPIRGILSRYRNATVLLDEARGFDLQRRLVKLAQGELAYDYLIVAAGASHS